MADEEFAEEFAGDVAGIAGVERARERGEVGKGASGGWGSHKCLRRLYGNKGERRADESFVCSVTL
jgi:hypothetical protein